MQLPASATFADAPALLNTLQQSLAGSSGPVRIDASALQGFDTSLLALLMHARRLCQAAKRPIELTGAPPKLLELARLYGVEGLLSLSPAALAPASGPASTLT